MPTEAGNNGFDGMREADNGSDPEVDLPQEAATEEQESREVVEPSLSNVPTESLTNYLQSESAVNEQETGPESEHPSSNDLSSEEGVMLEPSYNVLGRINFESDEEDDFEEIILEEEVNEEETISSKLTVITNDCIDLNKIEIVEEGYRRTGIVILPESLNQVKSRSKTGSEKTRLDQIPAGKNTIEERCQEKKSRFFRGEDDIVDISWEPTLESAQCKKDQESTFQNLDQFKSSLISSKTFILKSSFDSTVLFGMGETPVERYTLCNDRIEVDIINFGARVTAVRLFDQDKWVDVALGLDNAADYLSSKSDFMGATIGRVANRICKGKFKTPDYLGTDEFHLSKNDGEDHYNGGFRGLHKRMWEPKRCGDQLVMYCRCYDKEDGYPGNMEVWATFSLTGDSAFNVEYYAEADTVTPVNITNSIYFNLAGHDAGASSLYDHSVFVNAEVCCDSDEICDGKLGMVYQTPYNLTDLKHLGCVLKKEGNDGLDVSYVLHRKVAKQKRATDPIPKPPMTIAAIARHEESGRTLIVSTNQWGLRLYTCNKLKDVKGKGGGAVYGKHAGFCLQPGNLPNAVNVEHFPEAFITPFESYKHTTRYYFSIDRNEQKNIKKFLKNVPWLSDNVFLSCDKRPKDETESDEDFETPYKKTYLALEKLGAQVTKIDADDEDSLSLHSSFTSFGSSIGLPPAEGDIVVDPEETGDETAVRVTSDQIQCTPSIVVTEPAPLPPYLTGKWPRTPIEPKQHKEPLPTPTQRNCQTKESLTKSPKQEKHEKEVGQSRNRQRRGTKQKGEEYIRQIHLREYTDVNVGLINRVEEGKEKCSMDATREIPVKPDDLDLSDSSVEFGINFVKNPVMGRSGGWEFKWFESPERLPWYVKQKHGVQTSKSCEGFPPMTNEARRKRMGTLFKLINFPECYSKCSGTEAEIVQSIKIRNQYMKSLYNSLNYSPGHVTLYDGTSDL